MIKRRSPTVQLMTTSEFLAISSEISYQLEADVPDLRALLSMILGPVQVGAPEEEALTTAVRCLLHGYGDKRRKLGPRALIHPLRIAAQLSRFAPEPPTLTALLGALLHDKDEDLTERDMTPARYASMQREYHHLADLLGRDERWYLGERMPLLTRKPSQSYYEYLGTLIRASPAMPDLLHVKLADRIDNTLDTHVQRYGDTTRNFYQIIFNLLFVPIDLQIRYESYHAPLTPKVGALMLQQFYKNIVFLSLLRQEQADRLDPTVAHLFEALAGVSRRKAQDLILETLTERVTDSARRRDLLAQTLDYCQSGRLDAVTATRSDNPLDGSLTTLFSFAMEKGDKSCLAALFEEPERLTMLMFTFVAVFNAFIEDPKFYVKGIDATGARPID